MNSLRVGYFNLDRNNTISELLSIKTKWSHNIWHIRSLYYKLYFIR